MKLPQAAMISLSTFIRDDRLRCGRHIAECSYELDIHHLPISCFVSKFSSIVDKPQQLCACYEGPSLISCW